MSGTNSNMFESYDQIGKREDVSDVISDITPTFTPFQSSVGSEAIKNILFQWQEDALRAVKTNAQVEGAAFPINPITPTVMRSNTTQIMTEGFQITRTADKVATYGRARETAYQTVKAGKALKRDFENALVGTGQTMNVGADGTARTFAGVQAQIAPANIIQAPTVSDSQAATVPLTEDMVMAANELGYNAGAEFKIIQIKPSDAIRFANFALTTSTASGGDGNGRIRDVGTGTSIVNVIDVYRSPYGTQKVVLNRFQRATDALFYDPTNWKIAVFDPWTRKVLPSISDATQMAIVGEYSLKHSNQLASALVTALS